MYIHVCGIEGCRVRDFVWLAGVRLLWGRDTGCVLKPLATLLSFDSDQQRHTTTKLTNETRSVDPQDAIKFVCILGAFGISDPSMHRGSRAGSASLHS